MCRRSVARGFDDGMAEWRPKRFGSSETWTLLAHSAVPLAEQPFQPADRHGGGSSGESSRGPAPGRGFAHVGMPMASNHPVGDGRGLVRARA